MQNFNYHCHTSFEGVFDGKNTADEMISSYESKGFKQIGISNHCICNPIFKTMPPIHNQILGDIEKAIDFYKRSFDYIDEAASKHKIKVYKGFEVDYFNTKEWRNGFEKIIKEVKPDYLIGANHFLRNNDDSYLVHIFSLDKLPSSTTSLEKELLVRNYWQSVIREIESGYFDFIAHFDYCCLFGLAQNSEWNDVKIEVVERIASKKIACEINTGGLRTKKPELKPLGRPFPDWWLVKELIKRDVPLLISDDAHRIEEVGYGFSEVENKLTEFNCKNRFYLKD